MNRRFLLALALTLAACGAATRGSSERAEERTEPHVADRAALARETLRCTGTLNSAAALAEVQERRARATSCYERVLSHDASWRVQVRVDLVVERGGEVSYVSVGDVDRSDFADCLAGVMEGLRMPPLTSGECAIVAVPYRFHTEPAP